MARSDAKKLITRIHDPGVYRLEWMGTPGVFLDPDLR
jgi:hypothetical protein